MATQTKPKCSSDLNPADPSVFTWEDVIDKRIVKKEVHYLIKWKGFASSQNTWEPASNLPVEVGEFYETKVAPLLRRGLSESQPLALPGTSNGGVTIPGSKYTPIHEPQGMSTKPEVNVKVDTNGSVDSENLQNGEHFIGQIGNLQILGPKPGNKWYKILNYIPETKVVIKILFPQNPKQINETRLSYMVVLRDLVTHHLCGAWIDHRILSLACPQMIIKMYEEKSAFFQEVQTKEELDAKAFKAMYESKSLTTKKKTKSRRDKVPLIEDSDSSSGDDTGDSDDSDVHYEPIDISEFLRKRLLEDESDSD